jgi:hypothetical protein
MRFSSIVTWLSVPYSPLPVLSWMPRDELNRMSLLRMTMPSPFAR